MKVLTSTIIFFVIIFSAIAGNSQTDSIKAKRNHDYQIYLKQPAKEIKLLMYEKNFLPIQGKLSEDKKSIIINNYEQGTRVHIKVIYEDGTVDEFIKSPCFIDPVI